MRPERRWFSVALVICILSFLSLINADPVFPQTATVTIFGPKRYDKPKGRPVTYTYTFQARYPTARYTLWVQSGKEGLYEVKNVSVAINGIEIITSRDLRATNPASKVISIQPTNALTVTLKGQGGNYITAKVLCEGCSTIEIDYPTHGATINKPFTIIKGTLTTSDPEIGVVINGMPAQVQGINFAGIIPLQQGQNIVSATATDASGYKETITINIYAETIQESIRLTAIPSSGIPTLNVTFEAEAYLPNPVSNYSWDLNGDGTPDQKGSTLSKLTAYYQYPGLFLPKVTITDTQGNTFEETTIVNVLSNEEMDALLKGKWEGMKSAVINKDIEGALKFFEKNFQAVYREQFTALSPILNIIGSELGQIQLVAIEDNMAEYEIITTRGGVTYSYHLLFIRDVDGLWKIRVF